ncbi:MAG: hypothetical protein AAF411_26155 [Myxococcota bacterium]
MFPETSFELGDDARGALAQPAVHLAGRSQGEVQRILGALEEAGALRVRVAEPRSFFGYTAYHALAIDVPPGAAARQQITEAINGLLGPQGSLNGDLWIVPSRRAR